VAIKQSFLIPYPLGVADEPQHLFAVSGALAAFGGSIIEAIAKSTEIEDPTTADLFTEISRGIDQQLYFVESHLTPKRVDPAKGT
jgi:starvation-inducible DNA-binding protein